MSESIINILTIGRSGSSAVSKFISEFDDCLLSDNLPGLDEYNAKGYFEDGFINSLNENYLKDINHDIWETKELSNDDINLFHEKYKPQLKSYLESYYKPNKNFIIKNPRIYKLFEIYNELLNESSFSNVYHIFLFRHPDSFSKSANIIRENSIVEYNNAYESWYYLTYKVFEAFKENDNVILISFEDFTNNLDETRNRLENFLGLSINEESFQQYKTNFFDNKLIHHINDKPVENEYLNDMYLYLIDNINKNHNEIKNEKLSEWKHNLNFILS